MPFLQLPIASAATSLPTTLNVSTIAVNAQKESIFECWQFSLSGSSEGGVTGVELAQLGQGTSINYAIFPPGLDGGLHNAPAVQ